MTVEESPRALITWTVTLVIAAILAAWALYLVRHVVVLIYVSVLLAIGFSPLVRLVERQQVLPIGTRIPHWLAILIVYLGILAIIAGIAFLVLPPFIVQAQAFATQLPRLLEQAQRWLIGHGVLRQKKSLGEIVEQAPAGGDVVSSMLLTFWGLAGGMLGVVSVLILTFYLLVDTDSVFGATVRLFPKSRRPRVHAVARQITMKVSAWLTGQLMLAGIIGGTSAVWLGVLGIRYFYVLAVIAAVGEMIPIVGPIMAAVPGIAIAASTSWKLAVLVGGLYLVQQQLEANILVPKLMERQLGLTPVTIMVALLLGGELLGIAGAILAVPTAAIVQVIFGELSSDEG